MSGILKPRESIGEADRACEIADSQGELKWLKNSTFIPATCFAPPIPTIRTPRAWERIAVPSARGHQKIYKRIGAKRTVDEKYHAAMVELESQGFGERKRMRPKAFVSPYGDALFAKEEDTLTSGGEVLNKATEDVKLAMQAEDNLSTRNARSLACKPSTFDPAQLCWVPRKRHNTRWPVTPPDENCDLIAELQPLIKFELHPDQIQIDEPAFLVPESEKQISPLRVPEPEEQDQLLQDQKPKNRRRTIRGRQSLSTILEASDEPPVCPVLTPGPKAQPVFESPWKASGLSTTGTRFKTPTKVRESPMKIFTITASHRSGDEEVQVTKSQGHLRMSSPPNMEATTPSSPAAHSSPLKNSLNIITPPGEEPEVTNHQDHFSVPSDAYTEITTTTAPSAAENSSSSTYQTALPLFDAPVAVFRAQDEPQYEAKRRFSLDNARRSDRRSDTKIMKRVSHWMEGTTASKAKNRRHSQLPEDLDHDERSQRRRHTLDVDVGRNLDIFGQSGVTQRRHQRPRVEQKKPVQTLAALSALNTQPGTPPAANPPATSRPSLSAGPVPSIALTENGDKPDMSQAVEVDNETFADVEREVEKERIEKVGETTDVMMDQVMEAEGRTARVVTEEVDVDATAPEPDMKQQLEHAATSKNDVVITESEEDIDGDSALADLHSFVRRAKSSKERKDVPPTALILPSNASHASLAKQRRSGSMSSATSDAGSPMGKIEKMIPNATTASPRVPLGMKDANKSPSPAKKRKLKGPADDVPVSLMKKKSKRLVAPDLEDYDTEAPSQPKKRRRKIETNNTEDIFNPQIAFNQDLTKRGNTAPTVPDGGAGASLASRRSSRIATTTKKAAAIPVRLPGSSFDLDLGDMPVPSTVAFSAQKTEKDLATETRVNTRKNKGGAVSVPIALASLATVMMGQDDDGTTTVMVPKADGKNVRWDEVLVRVQGEEVAAVSPDEEDSTDKEPAEEEETALPLPPQLRLTDGQGDRPGSPMSSRPADDKESEQDHEPEPQPQARPQPEKELGSATRRSNRAATSRLPTRGGGVVGAAGTPAKKSPLPASSVVNKVSRGGAAARARLGMAGPGTPGPRRGGRRKV